MAFDALNIKAIKARAGNRCSIVEKKKKIQIEDKHASMRTNMHIRNAQI